ncbi:Similar to SMC1A: Structural maintenance of chromosomes protein 1A (Homo sapiens) [Cotesia congregata]|uniref:Structural maintenance of chromosomes protein n=1 Tax=Cotesia congregata TaxID=51543 RepID=A0A8J2HAM1_COTCN|nr:Similar to SMC1A: Structural maintenance of chromosomes protein 1A (Homo sapiens) [Cotesia congregata]
MMESAILNTKISRLEISFFKSFAGVNKIYPFELLNGVYGLNGSGKSNFLDAFAFCFNENLRKLRIRNAKQLIHIHADESEKTYVKCTFSFADLTEKSFTKEIVGSSFNYSIDDQEVEEKTYVQELINIGINIKNNIIVYQEDIQAIASLNGKNLTNLFERVSGSISFRRDYQSLLSQVEQARLDGKKSFNNKKELLTTQKRLRDISKTNRISHGLQEHYEKYLKKFILANLYILDVNIKTAEKNIQKLLKIKEKKENKIKERERILKELQKNIESSEKKIEKYELQASVNFSKKTTVRANFEELNEQIVKDKKKIESAKKNLEKAQEFDESRAKAIKELEDALKIENEKKKEYLDASNHDPDYWEKMEQQENEYQRLKTIVSEKNVAIIQALDILEYRRRGFDNQMENFHRQLNDLNNKLEMQIKLLSNNESGLKEIVNKIKEIEKESEEVRQDVNKLKMDTETSEKQRIELMTKLDEIDEKIHSLKLDKSQIQIAKWEEETLEYLKKTVKGVFGRMYQVCEPIHNRYKIPMAKVFGHFFSAIIVDTRKTAMKCVEILEQSCLTYEKFLPLDSLDAPVLQERLRDPSLYDSINNVKLLYDVLQFPTEISRAVLFVTKNTLVCELSKEANHVAYDLKSKNKHNCVSLDGTFYKTNGSFSGGKSSISKRVQLIDSQMSENLKTRKKEIMNAIKEGQKYLDNQSELKSLESKQNNLNWKIKYLKDAYNKMESECNELKESISKLTDEKKHLQLQCDEIQKELDKVHLECQELQNQNASIENKIYQDFCKNLGIKCISEYLNQSRLQEEKKSNLRKIKEQIERIESCIEYESNKNTSNNVKRWSDVVKNLENDLLDKKTTMKGLEKDLQALEKEEQLDKQKLDPLIEELNINVTELKKLRADIEKDKNSIPQLLSQIQNPSENGATLKADFHDWILRAKNEMIELPLLENDISLNDLYELIESVEPEDYDSQKLEEIYNLEQNLCFNYESLLEDSADGGNIDELLKVYEDELASLRQKLIAMPTSSTVESELDEVKKKIDQLNKEHREHLKELKKLTSEFEKVKKLRYDTFMESFESIREKLGAVYKKITGRNSAQAFLLTVNPEEPYLDEIKFKFVPPNKQNRGPVEPSGGEKTLAALSLLFSIHGDQHVPILLLDEIDADLDKKNVNNVIKYLNEAKKDQQIIFISHNDSVIKCADRVSGFYAATKSDHSKRTIYVSLDLNKYKNN